MVSVIKGKREALCPALKFNYEAGKAERRKKMKTGYYCDYGTLRELKEGEFFTTSLDRAIKASQGQSQFVWIKGEYDRSSKKYVCYKFNDINCTKLFNTNTIIYTNFTF